MSHVHRPEGHSKKKKYTPEEREKIMKEERWSYVHLGISQTVLDEHFDFLNAAVVIRSGAEGIPAMTTSGIYGPIYEKERIRLNQGADNVVERVSDHTEDRKSLLEELKELKKKHEAPQEARALTVDAKWVSGSDGGALPSVGKSSNVFGSTGSLYINNAELDFPIVDMSDEEFETTLGYYGAKLIQPGESIYMGYDKVIFGMEYNTKLPAYIQDYVMQPWGGGGLFVETHPFPHIWFPHPQTQEEKATNVCRILLGRVIPYKSSETAEINVDENKCSDIAPNPKRPQYHFTVFKIPTTGYAVAVDECTIHNDSFCNGKQVVFLANTKANTVAMRETSPYTNLRISDWVKPDSKDKK